MLHCLYLRTTAPPPEREHVFGHADQALQGDQPPSVRPST